MDVRVCVCVKECVYVCERERVHMRESVSVCVPTEFCVSANIVSMGVSILWNMRTLYGIDIYVVVCDL